MTKTIIVGDIHGCLEELDELLKIAHRPGHRLIFAGDLVDRGPDPAGVLRRARELNAESVMGNHEEKHLRYRRHELRRRVDPVYKNPMQPFSAQRLSEHESFSDEDWEYMARMPLHIRIGNWLVVHAGLEPRPFSEQPDNVLLRCRYVALATGKMLSLDQEDLFTSDKAAYWSTVWPGPESVIYGHHVHQGPAIDTPADGVTCVGIDTGCCFGHSLTAAILIGGEVVDIVSVPARTTYAQRML